MIKKLFLLSAIASVTACQSYSETSQCDPEKNYIISDPVAMEEYKKLRESGKIKSYYSQYNPTKDCISSICVSYSEDKFDFIEKYFDDNQRKGVYTIKKTTNIKDPECITEDPAMSGPSFSGYCFKVTKNENNNIKSEYKFFIDNSNEKVTIIKFIDLKTNRNLYEFSYQIYSTGAIGGPGFGTCSPQKINNPEYKFNPYSFHKYTKKEFK